MVNVSVLLISEDKRLSSGLSGSLIREGFEVTELSNYGVVTEITQRVVILDIQSNRGFEACRRMRDCFGGPIMMLASGGNWERIKAFAAGADDCMTKPADTTELIARIRALNARIERASIAKERDEEPIIVRDLCVDLSHHEVTIGGSSVNLTLTEFKLLTLLMRNEGCAISRQRLLKEIWSGANVYCDRVINPHVCRLRKKLRNHSMHPVRLVSVRGFGYRLQK